MRLARPVVAALALVAAIAGGAAVQPAPAAAELTWTTKGGHDGFESGRLDGWTCEAGASVVRNPVHSGTWALSGAAGSPADARCTLPMVVYPRATYKVTAWVRGKYVFLGAGGRAPVWAPGSTDAWHQLTLEFEAGRYETGVEIYLRGSEGRPYVADDVRVTFTCAEDDGACPSLYWP